MRPGPSIKIFLYLPLCLATLGLTSIGCGGFNFGDFNFSDSFNRAMEGAQRTPVWSSDGGWIVMNYGAKIYFVSSDGKHLREVAPLPEEGKKQAEVSPSISPGGMQIAFSTLRHTYESGNYTRRDQEIAMVSRDGDDYLRLTEHPGTDTNPVWSPDGKYIAFVSVRSPENQDPDESVYVRVSRIYRDILVMNSDGSDPRVVATALGRSLVLTAWSPDSRMLAFLLDEKTEEGVLQKSIYAVGADGTGLRKLSKATIIPAWSPDGTRIAFGQEGDDAALYSPSVQTNGHSTSDRAGSIFQSVQPILDSGRL